MLENLKAIGFRRKAKPQTSQKLSYNPLDVNNISDDSYDLSSYSYDFNLDSLGKGKSKR